LTSDRNDTAAGRRRLRTETQTWERISIAIVKALSTTQAAPDKQADAG
jgi:hypothetical protein